MNKSELSLFVKQQALKLGFEKAGIAAALKLKHAGYLQQWLKAGYHGTMHWMENYPDKRQDVRKLFPGARSVVVVAMNYYTGHQHSSRKEHGKISRYAWGRDYHTIIKRKLKELLRDIQKKDKTVAGRICVDTAPMQDKLWAVASGIGWQAKNTNIITRDYGSWIFLGELILNIELDYDKPVEDYCGSCRACLEACPTEALVPYKLDAGKCISYLTIEMWDRPVPQKFHDKIENWIFGCDICQDVCPWNRFQQETTHPDFQPAAGNVQPRLAELQNITEEAFKRRFKKSPILRAKWKNFIRNIKTVLAAKLI